MSLRPLYAACIRSVLYCGVAALLELVCFKFVHKRLVIQAEILFQEAFTNSPSVLTLKQHHQNLTIELAFRVIGAWWFNVQGLHPGLPV